MAMRLDSDIREVAELAQQRRREASGRVKSGEIVHLNFMGQQDCFDRAVCNLQQLAEKKGGDALIALADTINYALAAASKAADAKE